MCHSTLAGASSVRQNSLIAIELSQDGLKINFPEFDMSRTLQTMSLIRYSQL